MDPPFRSCPDHRRYCEYVMPCPPLDTPQAEEINLYFTQALF